MSSMTNLDCLNCDQFGEICSGLYKLILNWCIETFSIVRGRISLFIFCFDFFFNYLWSKFQLFRCHCIYQKNQFNLLERNHWHFSYSSCHLINVIRLYVKRFFNWKKISWKIYCLFVFSKKIFSKRNLSKSERNYINDGLCGKLW